MGNLRSPWTAARAKNGREGQLAAGRLLELVLHLLAQLHDASDVDFEDAMHVRAGALGQDHVLGDLLAHGAHGHEITGRNAADGLQRSGDRRSQWSFVRRRRCGRS